eukprot:c33216_g1_i1 orf=2-292(+)
MLLMNKTSQKLEKYEVLSSPKMVLLFLSQDTNAPLFYKLWLTFTKHFTRRNRSTNMSFEVQQYPILKPMITNLPSRNLKYSINPPQNPWKCPSKAS